MTVFFKTIMGEIASMVDKYSKKTTPTEMDKRLHNLHRLLLRVSIIIEEAEGRHITNKAMVHQLNLLRKEMYSGYFIMDSFKNQGFDTRDHDVSHSFALSKFNPAKRIFLTTVSTHKEDDLQKVLDNLNNIIEDMNGLVMFLNKYPPLRQPYSTHLFIGKCMFGRQMEMEMVMEFLMKNEHLGAESVGVLPIVGPTWVGKSTIIAHVCKDARVRDYFSHIMVFTGDNINNENLYSMKYVGMRQNERVLIVIELSRDVDEVAWNSLYSSYGVYLGRGSRIIITSRSNQIKKIGTTQALVLNFLPLEAYWYFFKVLTFGSVYSRDHPELESIAMEIARGLDGSFISANMVSSFLQNNLVSQQWRTSRAYFNKCIQKNVSMFGESPYHLVRKNKPTAYQINNDELAVWNVRHTYPETIPKITVQDVMFGKVKHEGEFDALLWKSFIPPYKSYILSCTIEKNHSKKMKEN